MAYSGLIRPKDNRAEGEATVLDQKSHLLSLALPAVVV